MGKACFVTGTDTGIGKTLIASALVYGYGQRGLRAVGMKPVAAGCEEHEGSLMSEDVSMLMAAGNVAAPLNIHNPYAFVPAIAPHIAAAQSGVVIRFEAIQRAYEELTTLADMVVVEGVGGFRVPLSDDLAIVQQFFPAVPGRQAQKRIAAQQQADSNFFTQFYI